uniref:Uncharacterized protein n=1 Tax=Myoviridae sp. ctfrL10 TaxID=2826678 RepID=A0A8S5MRQ6_9CAUD|nr:MAG TPA: hypothetical protein [Myoviridae sp. ctfrL10]
MIMDIHWIFTEICEWIFIFSVFFAKLNGG